MTDDDLKVAVCEAMIAVNAEGPLDPKRPWLGPAPIIPPTAIDWIGDAIVAAIVAAQHRNNANNKQEEK